jgi:hypothetical protein
MSNWHARETNSVVKKFETCGVFAPQANPAPVILLSRLADQRKARVTGWSGGRLTCQR